MEQEYAIETNSALTKVKNSQEVRGAILSRLEDNRQYEIKKMQEEHPEMRLEEIKSKIEPPNESKIALMAVGEVFENVLHNEPEIMPPETALTREITSVIENPDRYGLEDKLALTRHPDALYTEVTETGTIVITGAGEAKLGRLNARAVKQLESFLDNINKVVQFVEKSSPEELEEYGLVELAQRKKKHQPINDEPFIKVGDKFRVALIIPQDRGQKYEDLVKEVPSYKRENPKEVEYEIPEKKYQQLMKRIITIKRSKYKTEEIRETTKHILENWE